MCVCVCVHVYVYVLNDQVSKADDIDFKLIHGLMEDAIYGGRVDNVSDLRVLRTYVTELYSNGMLGRGGDLTRQVCGSTHPLIQCSTTWPHA